MEDLIRAMHDFVASLFGMLNKKTYIQTRLDFLVLVVTVLFLVMFIMDIFRRHIHSTLMTAIFNILDGVSDSVLIYLMGAMQTAAIKNELYPVWMLVLVMFRYSTGFISAYGVPAGRRFMEVRSVTNLVATASLNWKYGSRFQLPVWLLLSLQILRSFYIFISWMLAVNRIWLGWSSELISEYMSVDHDPSKWKLEECIPETMKGYKYLIYGERFKIDKPLYAMRISNDPSVYPELRRSSLITLEKIWERWTGKDIGDLSLAFALSRLLRCRLEDVTLDENIRHIYNRLVMKRIVEEMDCKRAFRIMELQLAFVNDYFNTRYPLIFWFGLWSLFPILLHSATTVCVVCWLSVDNWEMVVYLLSDWTRLLLVCMYASMEDNPRLRNGRLERLILSFFRSKVSSKRWHGVLDQYVFVQSYGDKQKFWNLAHKVTTGMVPKKGDGAELSSTIDVPEYVWPQVLEKLLEIMRHDEPRPQGSAAPPADDLRHERHGCHLPKKLTSSQVILVWHIATSICEMALAKERGVDLGKPGLIRSVVSHFVCCCSSKSYLIDVDEHKENHNVESCGIAHRFKSCFSSKSKGGYNKLEGALRTRYIVANSLSRYCAYLLVSKPEVIPDSFLVPKMVFQETVKTACDGILKPCDCDSLESRYKNLLKLPSSHSSGSIKKGDDVLKQGALLAKDLLEKNVEERWDILAGVWTEFLVHLAPTWNAAAHRTYLESGGEFITYIWALLWHCNIEKSSLWPQYDDASDKDEAPSATTPPQRNVAGRDNINPVMETRPQAGSDAINHQNATEIHEEGAVQETEEPEDTIQPGGAPDGNR
ncbi:hypothetical protein BS78_K313700, partial [Paspalum vaginatum]